MTVVEYQTENGPIGIAIGSSDQYGDIGVGRAQDIIDAGLSLREAFGVVQPIIDAIVDNLTEIQNKAAHDLESFTAEIGLELGAKGRFIVAEANAKASVVLTITWKPRKQ